MNCIKVFNKVNKEWCKLEFQETNVKKDYADFFAYVKSEKCFDDTVYLQVLIYNTGAVHILYTFDTVNITSEVLALINKFNLGSSWFKAYLDSYDGVYYLKLHFANINSRSNKQMVDVISFAINQLLSSETLNLLKPLTEITE